MAHKKNDDISAENLTDSTVVGWMEAENEGYLEDAKKASGVATKVKMVKIDNFSNKGKVLPEYGSWHLDRKKKMLKEHPEILKLSGYNPFTAVVWCIPVCIQLATAYYLQDAPIWQFFLLAYTIGALCAFQIGVIGHEGAHGLVFPTRLANKIFALIAFTPAFAGPFGNFWSVEHMYHHQVVVDKMNRYGPQNNGTIPKMIVTILFIHSISLIFFISSTVITIVSLFTVLLKVIGLRKTYFPTTFPLPPYNQYPQVIGKWLIINQIVANGFWFGLYYFFGWTGVLYFYFSNACCNSLHPLGMRQVQEHYLRNNKQPTNSVYSIFSVLFLNVGYHNEHHDFPNVPWNRLPQIHKIAREYYDSLFYYTSYTDVLKNFLFDKGIPTSVLLEGSIFDN